MENDLRPKERFTGLAREYDKARPDYSDEAIDFIREHCHLQSGNLLVDIGSGTGISSRAFARRGLKVIGIEPNADMLMHAEAVNKELKNSSYELPTYKNMSAEHTDLPAQYADIVISAQAFHWFDAEKSLAEFGRILKAKGWVVLMWNLRDESDEVTKAYSELIRKYGKATDRATMAIEADLTKTGNKLFDSNLFVKKEKFVFPNEQNLDEEGLISRAFSVSYAPTDPDTKEKLRNGLQRLFLERQEKGQITLKYSLVLYMACRQ